MEDNRTLADTVSDDDGTGDTLLSQQVLPSVEIVEGAPTLRQTTGPRFLLQGGLGRGGGGEVLRAHDQAIGRDVAIKRLKDRGQSHGLGAARFVSEMRITGGLNHPNIIPVHDVGVDEEGELFFVMRHIRGETLAQIIGRLAADDQQTHAAYPIIRRLEIFRGVLDAVAYAHSRGIIHRDLKPDNIMVGPFGEVLVMDWGVAKPAGEADDLATFGPDEEDGEAARERAFETRTGALIGTPAYMAPEQLNGAPVDERTDVYALSVLLHELLFLEHYLDGRNSFMDLCQGVLNEPVAHRVRTKSRRQPTVPADLMWFIEQGMEKAPGDRHATVVDMARQLDERAEGRIPLRCHITTARCFIMWLGRSLDRYPRRFFVVLALLCAGLMGLLLLGLLT